MRHEDCPYASVAGSRTTGVTGSREEKDENNSIGAVLLRLCFRGPRAEGRVPGVGTLASTVSSGPLVRHLSAPGSGARGAAPCCSFAHAQRERESQVDAQLSTEPNVGGRSQDPETTT